MVGTRPHRHANGPYSAAQSTLYGPLAGRHTVPGVGTRCAAPVRTSLALPCPLAGGAELAAEHPWEHHPVGVLDPQTAQRLAAAVPPAALAPVHDLVVGHGLSS